MCAGVVDEEEVSDFHFRKHAVDREFIVVFALLAFCKPHGKLITDLVGFFGGDLSGFE